jgi:hypothetical protein
MPARGRPELVRLELNSSLVAMRVSRACPSLFYLADNIVNLNSLRADCQGKLQIATELFRCVSRVNYQITDYQLNKIIIIKSRPFTPADVLPSCPIFFNLMYTAN